LECLDKDSQEKESRRLIFEEARRLFDLARGPALHIVLVRFATDRHTLLYKTHHITTDFVSMEIWRREVALLYEAFSKGCESPLTELPIQYADYAVWQRSRLKGEMLESYLTYWKKQAFGAKLLHLPTDWPRPEKPTSAGGAIEEIRIHPPLLEKLKKLDAVGGMTSFMALLSGVAVLINRRSGQRDISIGSLGANRSQAGVEGLIGFFANPVLFRITVEENLTVLQLLNNVKGLTLETYARQELPWYVAVAAGFQDVLKSYSGWQKRRFELLKRIGWELFKTMRPNSVRLAIGAVFKKKAWRSLKSVACSLLKPTTISLFRSVAGGSLENIKFESLIAGWGRREIDAWVSLMMFFIRLRPDLAREILEEPEMKRLMELVVEFPAAYGLWNSSYGRLARNIIEQVQPGRDVGRNKAHLVLNLMHVPDQKSELAKAPSSGRRIANVVDLKLDVLENNLGLRICAAYNRDLFKSETVAGILKDLQRVLEEFVQNPEKRISELDISRHSE
jgi:hypothetical protein